MEFIVVLLTSSGWLGSNYEEGEGELNGWKKLQMCGHGRDF